MLPLPACLPSFLRMEHHYLPSTTSLGIFSSAQLPLTPARTLNIWSSFLEDLGLQSLVWSTLYTLEFVSLPVPSACPSACRLSLLSPHQQHASIHCPPSTLCSPTPSPQAQEHQLLSRDPACHPEERFQVLFSPAFWAEMCGFFLGWEPQSLQGSSGPGPSQPLPNLPSPSLAFFNLPLGAALESGCS